MAIIEERIGDIFKSPPHSILIHACNTKGSWGKGVAAAFKKYSPAAYTFQHHHCTTPSSPSTPLLTHQRNLVGTCLLIPPFPSLPASTSPKTTKPPPPTTAAQQEKQYWIACLFTSHGFGKSVDTPESILEATRKSVEDLRRQIRAYKERGEGESGSSEKYQESQNGGDDMQAMAGCVSVRINSGLFGVEWERTKAVLEEGGMDMVIVRPPDKDGEGGKRGDEKDARKDMKGVKRKVPEEGKNGTVEKRQMRLRFGKGK
ncbi:MAG: hypothetical protein LQ338_007443 [Usnochroma carphineum]|nr:MAG: hypothetical protein LQ338_007443 [Usnochroma carphineum]